MDLRCKSNQSEGKQAFESSLVDERHFDDFRPPRSLCASGGRQAEPMFLDAISRPVLEDGLSFGTLQGRLDSQTSHLTDGVWTSFYFPS